MNLVFIAFALLAVVPPLYTRYEHLHNRDDPIPTQLKWTAQVTVGSGAAAYSVCRIVTTIRGSNPNTIAGSFYCSSLGVAGGAMSTGAMTRNWEGRDWTYFRRVTRKLRGAWEGENNGMVQPEGMVTEGDVGGAGQGL